MPKSRTSGLLLLDTHAWYWLSQEDKRLRGSSGTDLIDEAGAEGRLGIAAISVWELAMLDSNGRIHLHPDCLTWVRVALSEPRIRLFPLSPEIAVESTRLPGHLPRDPADRIIVATARILGGALVTADEALIEYARSGHLDVVPV